MKHSHRSRKRTALYAVIGLVIAAALLFGAAYYEKLTKSRDDSVFYDYSTEDRRSGNSFFMNGTEYVQKPGMETILVMGLDKYYKDTNAVDGAGETQQCDFISVLVIDSAAEEITSIMINRDTMCSIYTITDDGKPGQNVYSQICLAHSYGTGKEDSCENAVRSVSDLLGGTVIDHYLSFTMDAVPVVNDLCGGITLECTDDFTDYPDFVKGNTITLKGTDALRYVRGRMGVAEDPTNVNRMNRQIQYLELLYDAAVEKLQYDSGFIVNLAKNTADYIVSDIPAGQISTLAERLAGYEFKGIVTLPGTADYSGKYAEFYIDEQGMDDLLTGLLYEPAEQKIN